MQSGNLNETWRHLRLEVKRRKHMEAKAPPSRLRTKAALAHFMMGGAFAHLGAGPLVDGGFRGLPTTRSGRLSCRAYEVGRGDSEQSLEEKAEPLRS